MAKTAPKGARGAAGKKGKKGGGGRGGALTDGGAPAAGGAAGGPHARKLAVRATTPKGRRALAAREPKETEDLKGTVMLYGRKASQVVKDVMADLARLKPGEVTRLTRLNPEAAPFDPPGSAGVSAVETLARKADAGLFILGSHTKKRPHALTVGRLFDGRLLDAVEFGIDPDTTKLLRAFGSAPTAAQAGHKPALAFVGGGFEGGGHPAGAAAKSLLLDLFRGRVVPAVNLAGVDRLILVVAEGGGGGGGGGGAGAAPSTSSPPTPPLLRLAVRQYCLRLKKSGGRTPRVEAAEIGPALDLSVRRHLPGPPDLVKAALKAAAGPAKKKEKNVSTDTLDGKVGRLYVPRQDLAGLALAKAKGVKRARREAAAERAAAGAAGGVGGGGGGGGGGAGPGGEEESA